MNLSLLSLECVIPHLDANKRVLLSLCYKSFRKLEKRIEIKLDKLIVTQSEIKINDKRYKFGEIQDMCQIDGITEKKRFRIEKNNSKGGVEWMSRRCAVLEPGDVELPRYWDETFLEAEKYELMQSVRRMFMSALERFYDSKTKYNPLRDLMDDEYIFKVFEKIETESREMFITSTVSGMNPVKLEQDEFSLLYPRAFKNIIVSIETLKNPRNGEILDILRKLAYPQMIYPHFNQFTVFNDDSQDYHNRLPDGLSLRQAFKQFSTVLLGRRNKIRVQKFELHGKGIIPLPVGFQIDCFYVFSSTELLAAYNSTVRYVERMPRSVFDEQTLRLPLIQNCRILEILLLESSIPLDAFRDLLNQVLILKMPRESRLSPLEFFNEWVKNDNRRIGSKFIIAFDARDVSSVSLETKIFDNGFRETPRSSSYYRELSGGKKAVLNVDKDISRRILRELDIAWSLDWNYHLLDYCCFVEIVGSE